MSLLVSRSSFGATKVTVVVKPSNLTGQSVVNPLLKAVIKGEKVSLSNGNRKLNITDARGSGQGWNLIITSTDFVNQDDPAKKISPRYLAVTGQPLIKVKTGNEPPKAYTGTVVDGLKLLSASPASGMGAYSVSYKLKLSAPSGTPDGTYQAVITETLISGP